MSGLFKSFAKYNTKTNKGRTKRALNGTFSPVSEIDETWSP
jgi:hypothetical protein